MSRRSIVVGRHATLAEAENLFEKHDFNLLPVVERLRLVGVLTKTDFLRAFRLSAGSVAPPYDKIMTQEVEAFMTAGPTAFAPETPLTQVLEQMVVTRHRSFPVVESDLFVGIISREDVIRALRRGGAQAERR